MSKVFMNRLLEFAGTRLPSTSTRGWDHLACGRGLEKSGHYPDQIVMRHSSLFGMVSNWESIETAVENKRFWGPAKRFAGFRVLAVGEFNIEIAA